MRDRVVDVGALRGIVRQLWGTSAKVLAGETVKDLVRISVDEPKVWTVGLELETITLGAGSTPEFNVLFGTGGVQASTGWQQFPPGALLAFAGSYVRVQARCAAGTGVFRAKGWASEGRPDRSYSYGLTQLVVHPNGDPSVDTLIDRFTRALEIRAVSASGNPPFDGLLRLDFINGNSLLLDVDTVRQHVIPIDGSVYQYNLASTDVGVTAQWLVTQRKDY